MPNNPIILPKGVASADGKVVDSSQTGLDSSNYGQNIPTSADTAKLAFDALNALDVSGGNLDPINVFDSTTLVNADNIETFASHTNIYTRQTTQCGDALTIQVAGLTQTTNGDPITYPYEMIVRHAGPDRSTRSCSSSDGPSEIDGRLLDQNELIVHFRNQDGSRQLFRLVPSDLTNRTFFAMNQGDSISIVFESANAAPLVERLATEDPRLNQRFDLSDVTIRPIESLGRLIYSQDGYIGQKGEEFVVTQSGTIDGFDVKRDDVLKALVNSPNLFTLSTTDWAVIRNISSFSLPASQKSLLNQSTEHDTISSGAVSGAVEIWLLDDYPTAAPLLADAVTRTGTFTATETLRDKTVLVAIDNSINTEDLLFNEGTALGEDVLTPNFNDAFVDFGSIIPDTSNGSYYILGSAVDSTSVYSLQQGHTISIRERNVDPTFTLSDKVRIGAQNLDPIPVTALDQTLQAIINADHGLTPSQVAATLGITVTDGTTAFDPQLVIPRHYGALSNTRSDYQDIRLLNGIVSDFAPRTVTFLLPRGSTDVGLNLENGNPSGIAVTKLTPVFGFDSYQVNLPASNPGGLDPIGTVYVVTGNQPNITPTGLADSVKLRTINYTNDSVTVEKLSAAVRASLSGGGYTPPEKLTDFLDHTTLTHNSVSGWRDLPSPTPPVSYTREYKYLFSQDRASINAGTSQFDDITGVALTDFAGNNVFVYTDENQRYNTAARGLNSYILNTNVFVGNASGQTTVSDSNNKVIGFTYVNQELPDVGQTRAMVRHGSGQQLLGFSHEEGLFAYIARNDGGSHSRTRNVPLEVDGGHWHDQVDDVETAEAEVVLDSSLTGSVDVIIDIQLDDNGNDEGTHEETVTITNVGADQNLGSRTFSYSGFPSITLNITYEHDNNDLSTSRRVLFLRPQDPFTNAALTYNVAAHRVITETWTTGITYARSPVNAGDAHDQFGLFDPVLWHTERVGTLNRVRYALINRYENDTSANPEQSLLVVSEGDHDEDVRSHYTVHINRPLSDFTNDDIRQGNNAAAIGELIGIQADRRISIDDLIALDDQEGENFGVATDRADVIETLTFSGNIELAQGFGLIFTDTDDGIRKVLEISTGSTVIKNA